MGIESFGIGPEGFSIGLGGGGQSTSKSRVLMRLNRENAAFDRANTYDQAFDNIDRFREKNFQWDQNYTDMDVRAAKQKQLNEIAAMRESGLHPAFSAGIGGAGPASLVGGGPTVSGGVTGYGGGGGGRAGGSASFKLVNKSVAEFNAANKDLIQARADLIKEQIQDIRDARGAQGQSGIGVPGSVEAVPDTVISPHKDFPAETAGRNHPGWKNFKMGDGKGESISAPADSPSEMFESPTMWPTILSVKSNRQAIQNILDRKSVEALKMHPSYRFFQWAKKKLNIGNARTYPLINEDSP